MIVPTQTPTSHAPHTKPSTAERLLLTGISWKTYDALCKDLEEQRWPRMNYDRGNLEFEAPGSTDPTMEATKEERFLLRGIRWETYELLCKDLTGRRTPRMNYDRGDLEFVMAILRIHELYKLLLSYFVVILAEELGLSLALGGQTTMRRKDVERGLEMDDCFWIRNEPLIRGKTQPDFTTDPPPDLAIEVEITHGLLDRLHILAALRVPEIWWFRSERLIVGLLQTSGAYRWTTASQAFPQLPIQEVERFLLQAETTPHMEIIRSFRAWVRENLIPRT